LDVATELSVRIGIATGPVVVGDTIGEGASQESAVVGETPNLAARLQSIASPDSVVVSPSTWQLSAGSIDYVSEGSCELDGFAAPITIWRAATARSRSSGLDLVDAVKLAPLVGREPEVALLLDRWRRAKGGEGQVVLICGEAGIGKTQLLKEFQRRIEKELRNGVFYYCSPYERQSAFYAARDQLSRGFRFTSDDDTVRKLDKIEGGCALSACPRKRSLRCSPRCRRCRRGGVTRICGSARSS